VNDHDVNDDDDDVLALTHRVGVKGRVRLFVTPLIVTIALPYALAPLYACLHGFLLVLCRPGVLELIAKESNP
jgi:hypothetical protein